MAGTGTKRIIELTEASTIQNGDFIAVDSNARGTKKVPTSALATSAALAAETNARAGADEQMSERMDGIEEQTALIQNPTKTLSGALVSFTDGADMPMVACTAEIVPKQSGSGTPSPDNVRPISGWESVSVNVNSMNLFPNTLGVQSVTKNGVTFDITEENGFITDIYMHGTATGHGSLSFATMDNGFQLPKGILKMYLAGDKTTSGSRFDLNVRRVGSPQDIVATTTVVTITNEEVSDFGSAYIYFYNGAVLNHHIMPCIVPTDVDTSAYPKYPIHNGTTKTVNLGRTVYGGEAEIVGGSLTDKMAMVDLGTLDWIYRSNIGGMTATLSPMAKDQFKAVCSIYPYGGAYYELADKQCGYVYGNQIFVKDNDYTDEAAFKTAMSGVQLVYELATPQTYQLTPTEVSTLLGENNVWADSGDVEITYRRDISIVINNLESALNG